MVQQRIWLAAPPDCHQQRVGDELRRHLRLHRPADDPAREQINHGGDVQPAFRRPHIGEVGDPFAVRLIGRELPVERVRRHGCGRPLSLVLRQAPAARARAQRIRPHEPLDPVQAAGCAVGEHVPPDSSRPVGPGACNEACPHLRRQLLVGDRPGAWLAMQPGVEPGSRDAQRFAQPCHRPDRTVLRDKAELHIDSFAK